MKGTHIYFKYLLLSEPFTQQLGFSPRRTRVLWPLLTSTSHSEQECASPKPPCSPAWTAGYFYVQDSM